MYETAWYLMRVVAQSMLLKTVLRQTFAWIIYICFSFCKFMAPNKKKKIGFSLNGKVLRSTSVMKLWVGKRGTTPWPETQIVHHWTFLCQFIKYLFYTRKIRALLHCERELTQSVPAVTPEMLQTARQKLVYRLDVCRISNSAAMFMVGSKVKSRTTGYYHPQLRRIGEILLLGTWKPSCTDGIINVIILSSALCNKPPSCRLRKFRQ
ncbi:hypothetical protein Cfor_09031 [Coptotermes formosanus]|uniref:Uncharacterized protein n=1 Tax=Coptotermes formosanus TaxID=36987 RepID=A0A6L2Q6G8_COPFO|nr:hypothetical protein Cfor_09031 [Coptotermes formosanus]